MSKAADPDKVFPGVLTVVAPHMDDELIGCGGILASLRDGSRAHVIYASDGSASPVSVLPWHRSDREELARARKQEARAGLRELGIPEQNAHFLELPDGCLPRARRRLEERLAEALETVAADHVLVPFRMDRQSDHLAVARAAQALHRRGLVRGEILEYFVYARWKLIAGGDIRHHIRPELLLRFEPNGDALARKRRAFQAHRTQTSRFYAWQKRANLTAEFLDETCQGPEYLLCSNLGDSLHTIFPGGTAWIRTVHALEPRLKKGKDLVMEVLRG